MVRATARACRGGVGRSSGRPSQQAVVEPLEQPLALEEPNGSLQGFEAGIVLAGVEQLRRRGGRGNEDPGASDTRVEAERVGDDDLEETPDAGDVVETLQVVGDAERALPAAADAAGARSASAVGGHGTLLASGGGVG